MDKSTKYFVLTIIVVLFFSLFFFLHHIWRESEETAYLSCISSVASQIQQSSFTKDLIAVNKDWKIMSEKEIDFLLSKIQGYDCGQFENQTVDIWNRRINIALKRPKDRIEIMIWSNGQDGISGTSDDLVIPYGEKAPK